MNTEDVYLGGKVVASTDRGVLVDIEGHGEEWLPKSCIDAGLDTDLNALVKGEELSFSIPNWIALERGVFDD